MSLETPIPKVSYEMYVILRYFCRLFAHGSLFLHHGSYHLTSYIPILSDPTNHTNPKNTSPSIPSRPVIHSRWRISRPCFRSRVSEPSTPSTPGFLGSWVTRASRRCRRASGGSCFSAWRRAWEKGKGSWRWDGSTKGAYHGVPEIASMEQICLERWLCNV